MLAYNQINVYTRKESIEYRYSFLL